MHTVVSHTVVSGQTFMSDLTPLLVTPLRKGQSLMTCISNGVTATVSGLAFGHDLSLKHSINALKAF